MRFRPLRDFALAAGFLTVLPLGRDWTDERAEAAVGYYPWVGWLLGGVAALLAWALTATRAPQLVGGNLVIVAWALLTGLLHWDGLADTADGLWGGKDPARRLEIMRDTHLGAYGAAVLALTALLQAAGAVTVLSHRAVWVLVSAPVLARAAAAVAAWTLPAARADGLGLAAVRRPTVYPVAVAAVAVAALLVLGYLAAPLGPFFATLAVGGAAGLLLPRLLARPVGGMTGDLFGATILGVETIVLVTGALLT